MKCPYCSEEIEENLKTCPVCGESLKKASNPPPASKKISNTVKIIGITAGAALVSGLLIFGIVFSEINGSKTIVLPHEDIDPYENTLTRLESLNKTVENEKALSAYLKGAHLKSSKERAFYNFLLNTEYYSKVFSYQNQAKCGWGSSDMWLTCISGANRMFRYGRGATIDRIELEHVYGEPIPSNSRYGNIKITKPEVPFIKLVFNPYYCSDIYYLNGGPGFISRCNGSSHYFAEPNYKYIKTTYSKYLNVAWEEYFDIKIKQQEDLRSSAFANGNGGMFPAYISKEVNEWSKALISFLEKHPNFIMYDDITEQILDMNYPGYDALLKEVKKGTKLYKAVKQAKDDFEAEYGE